MIDKNNTSTQKIKFYFVTLFPESFPGPLGVGIIGKGIENNFWEYETVDLKLYGKKKRVDDETYGGGSGMVITTDTIHKCIEDYIDKIDLIIFTSPSGYLLKQKLVERFNFIGYKNIFIICSRYEGFDARIIDYYKDINKCDIIEVCCGDYILCGGELGAMIIAESMIRLIPGMLNNPESIVNESFSNGLLEHPQYTRPYDWKGYKVPDVLISGHHKEIEKWKLKESFKRTLKYRNELI